MIIFHCITKLCPCFQIEVFDKQCMLNCFHFAHKWRQFLTTNSVDSLYRNFRKIGAEVRLCFANRRTQNRLTVQSYQHTSSVNVTPKLAKAARFLRFKLLQIQKLTEGTLISKIFNFWLIRTQKVIHTTFFMKTTVDEKRK